MDRSRAHVMRARIYGLYASSLRILRRGVYLYAEYPVWLYKAANRLGACPSMDAALRRGLAVGCSDCSRR
jgi:hypothetical protein